MTTPDGSPTIAQTLPSLQAQGLERLDAQRLLLHALGKETHDRAWLLAHDRDPIGAVAWQHLATLVQRRQQGEPMAYLTGHQEFYGLDLRVDARVLVPRPDTETLVDWALSLLPLRLGEGGGEGLPLQQIIDLGTGSGAIALALKATRPELQVSAIDASAAALAVARANAERLGLDVSLLQSCWFSQVSGRYHLIVSNPPYIAAQDSHLAALRHEPLPALSSGADGLDDLRQIIGQAPAHLHPGGWLLLEHGHQQAQAVRGLLLAAGFADVQSRRDLSGIERCSGGRTAVS